MRFSYRLLPSVIIFVFLAAAARLYCWADTGALEDATSTVEAVATSTAETIATSTAETIATSTVEAVAISTPLDTDHDGYSDAYEIAHGYSPFTAAKVDIKKSDVDHDGLSDYLEIKFHTDPFKADTDGDGYPDGEEVSRGYDPLSASTTKRLVQTVKVDLSEQRLYYYVSGQEIASFTVSTGKASTPTAPGKYKITDKILKAWSRSHKLWMPYWLGLDRGGIGIHELPVWPNGYREGSNHLGRPVSHGCIRLGIGPAEYLYDRLSVGTAVTVVK